MPLAQQISVEPSSAQDIFVRFVHGEGRGSEYRSTGLSNLLVFLMAIVSAGLTPSRMLFSTGAPDDSSVFAYIGWAMTKGLAPYRDLWDHKGPLLYLLQFAGISLHPASTAGIGILEVSANVVAFFLVYRIIASFASRPISLGLGVLCLAFVAHFGEGGNLCESWSLLPLAAAHYSLWRWSKQRTWWWGSVLASCWIGIFWIRPNIAVFPAMGLLGMLYFTQKDTGLRAWLQLLSIVSVTVAVVTGAILLPIYRAGAFHNFIACYFGYNSAYAGSLSWSVRVLHTRQLIVQLFASGLAILGAGGWALTLKQHQVETTQSKIAHTDLPLNYLTVLLLSLPLEIVAACVSGRDYAHYVLPLFPSFAIFSGLILNRIENSAKEAAQGPLLAVTLLMGFVPLSLATYSADFAQSSTPIRQDYLQLIRFIDRTTKATDRIVVVGGDEAAYIAHRAGRLPGSRFVYQYPLTDAANPIAFDQRREFMCDLVANRPAVIISGNPLLGMLCSTELECWTRNNHPPLSDYGYDSVVLPKLLKGFIASDYKPVDDPRFEGIHAFVRRDIAVPASW